MHRCFRFALRSFFASLSIYPDFATVSEGHKAISSFNFGTFSPQTGIKIRARSPSLFQARYETRHVINPEYQQNQFDHRIQFR